MDLILWRHCAAADGVPDESRPLTPLGMQQAARMARWLGERLPVDCRVVVSPALRAQQTARSLRRAFETDPRLASGAAPDAVLAVANASAEAPAVLIVGHQPTLGQAASLLLDGESADRAMQTGEVLWLACGTDGSARLVHAVTLQSA